jgi:putative transposase
MQHANYFSTSYLRCSLNLWQRLLFSLTGATDNEMVRKLQFALVQVKILRGKLGKRITVTPQERRSLLRFGKPLGCAIRELISIVSPGTFLRWIREEDTTTKPARTGRPRTPDDLRRLILRMASESAWSAERIHGELAKLGLASISESTVRNILRAEGVEPAPERGQGTWAQFVQRHAATLWGCDFFTQKILTASGFADCFVFFFLHIGSRRVHIAGFTTNPTQAWVAEQAKNFCEHAAQQPFKTTHLIRDFDGKFGAEFDATLKAKGIKVMRVGPRRPKMNAHAERWIQSIRREALGHFIVFGEKHLRYLLSEYLAHYNGAIGGERPHQGLGNMPLAPVIPAPPASDDASTRGIICRRRLGGLLKHYYHHAA